MNYYCLLDPPAGGVQCLCALHMLCCYKCEIETY